MAFEPSKQPGTSTLKVLNFMVTKMMDNFEIFYIIPDSLYVNPHRLKGKSLLPAETSSQYYKTFYRRRFICKFCKYLIRLNTKHYLELRLDLS